MNRTDLSAALRVVGATVSRQISNGPGYVSLDDLECALEFLRGMGIQTPIEVVKAALWSLGLSCTTLSRQDNPNSVYIDPRLCEIDGQASITGRTPDTAQTNTWQPKAQQAQQASLLAQADQAYVSDSDDHYPERLALSDPGDEPATPCAGPSNAKTRSKGQKIAARPHRMRWPVQCSNSEDCSNCNPSAVENLLCSKCKVYLKRNGRSHPTGPLLSRGRMGNGIICMKCNDKYSRTSKGWRRTAEGVLCRACGGGNGKYRGTGAEADRDDCITVKVL